MNKHLMFLFSIFAIGCSSPQITPMLTWGKSNTTDLEFHQDRYNCIKEASANESKWSYDPINKWTFEGKYSLYHKMEGSIFVACMYSKGYKTEGPFSAPWHGVINLTNQH